MGGCITTLQSVKGTSLFPELYEWNDAILFLETPETKPEPMYFRYWIRDLGCMGVLEKINGIIVGKPYDECYYTEYKHILLQVLNQEFQLYDLPVLYNLNFGHTAPMIILPYGALAEIDCIEKKFSIVSQAVKA